MAAHAKPGDVDPSFGLDGMVLHPASSVGGGVIAQESDGRLIIQGGGCDETGSGVARLEDDGGLDRSFGDNGHARVGLCVLGGVIQRDGKLVVYGSTLQTTFTDVPHMAAGRLERDGTPDRSFGKGGGTGFAVDAFMSGAAGAAEDREGRLVVVGLAQAKSGAEQKMIIARLRPDGSPDPTFGSDGIRRLAPPGAEGGLPAAVAVQKDDAIVVAGSFQEPVETWRDDWMIARLKPSGALDSTFGGDGFAVSRFNRVGAAVHSMLMQPDGKIVLAGEGSLTGVAESLGEKAGPNAMTIIRYLPSGTPDKGFGDGGTIHTLPGGDETLSRVTGIARQPDGDLVAGGYYFAGTTPGEPLGAWIVNRYERDGSPDPSFGVDGRVMTKPDGIFPMATSLALQADGHKILVGGGSDCGGWGRTAFIRYLADDGPPLPDRGPAMRSCDSKLTMEPEGEIQLPVNCPMIESGCAGTATLHMPAEVSSARHRRPQLGARIGRARFRLKGGGSVTLKVPASAAARDAVKRQRRIKVVAVFAARDPKGHKRVIRRTLTVRAMRSR
jgi:uncharacterized delta-60 repeat protein